MDGWLEKMKIEQSSASAGLKLAELGKKNRVKISPKILVYFNCFLGALANSQEVNNGW